MYPKPKRRTRAMRDLTGHDIDTKRIPITTQEAYLSTLKELDTMPEEQMNMKMQRLCEGRSKLAHLILAFKNIQFLWKSDERVVESIRILGNDLEEVLHKYPLQIMNRKIPVVPKA